MNDDFNEGDMAEELIEYALLAMTLQECIDIARKQVRHDILALSSDNIQHMYNSLIGETT
jgi:hypothetical protein